MALVRGLVSDFCFREIISEVEYRPDMPKTEAQFLYLAQRNQDESQEDAQEDDFWNRFLLAVLENRLVLQRLLATSVFFRKRSQSRTVLDRRCLLS